MFNSNIDDKKSETINNYPINETINENTTLNYSVNSLPDGYTGFGDININIDVPTGEQSNIEEQTNHEITISKIDQYGDNYYIYPDNGYDATKKVKLITSDIKEDIDNYKEIIEYYENFEESLPRKRSVYPNDVLVDNETIELPLITLTKSGTTLMELDGDSNDDKLAEIDVNNIKVLKEKTIDIVENTGSSPLNLDFRDELEGVVGLSQLNLNVNVPSSSIINIDYFTVFNSSGGNLNYYITKTPYNFDDITNLCPYTQQHSGSTNYSLTIVVHEFSDYYYVSLVYGYSLSHVIEKENALKVFKKHTGNTNNWLQYIYFGSSTDSQILRLYASNPTASTNSKRMARIYLPKTYFKIRY